MAYPVVTAGMTLTASMLQDMQWQSVEQGTQQDKTSSTVLVDTNLVMTAAAGAVYMYRLLVSYTAGTTGDIQLAWTAPTNGAVDRFGAGTGQAATVSTDINSMSFTQFRRPATTTPVRIGGGGVGQGMSYHEDGVIRGGDGGAFTLQFAQVTSDAGTTSFTASSRLDWIRIA